MCIENIAKDTKIPIYGEELHLLLFLFICWDNGLEIRYGFEVPQTLEQILFCLLAHFGITGAGWQAAWLAFSQAQ